MGGILGENLPGEILGGEFSLEANIEELTPPLVIHVTHKHLSFTQ
jgi:hypothetical protein